jgi:hypothetical protein
MVFCPADNIAAGIRETERNASARSYCRAFFLGSWSGYLRFLSCFARYVSQIRLIIARRTLRFAEINLFSWGPFHRRAIGDLNTWHLFLQSGCLTETKRRVREFQL